MAIKGVKVVGILLLLVGVAVETGAFRVPGFETDVTLDDLAKAAQGERDIKVEVGRNGVKISSDYTTEQKILFAGLGVIGLIALIGCCACCKNLCCEPSRPPTTNIVYQNMGASRPGPGYHVSLPPIHEGRTVQDQPPPYYATTVANGKH
jgi:hypothetical protein